MAKNSHDTNVEDPVTFGIAKTGFQNVKQSSMMECLVLGNTESIKREDFPFLLKHSLENSCTTVLNRSGRSQSGATT